MKLQLVAVPLSALLFACHVSVAQNASTATGTTGSTSAAGTAGAATGTIGTGNATTANSGDRAAATDRASEKAWERTHRASKMIGTDVRNRQGQKIGDVKDVVLDANGQIAYTVVSTGGFLGVGDRLHAIPWTALQKDTSSNHFVLDMDKQRLKDAPGFDSKHWPNFADEHWNTENRNHYANPSR